MTSTPVTFLIPNESDHRKLDRFLEQINVFNVFIDKDTKITGILKKDISKVVIFLKFDTSNKSITPNKVVITKEILINLLLNFSILNKIQNVDKNFLLAQLLTKLHDDISKASKTWFSIYYVHYKDKVIGNLILTFICIANCFCFLCY